MGDSTISTLTELMDAIQSARAELESFLAGLHERDASMKDANGWTVRDHVTHIAVWEDSVAVLFRGGKRHEALGIDERLYAEASFDDMNDVIKRAQEHLTLAQAVAVMHRVHEALMDDVRRLSDAELGTTVRYRFPNAPQSDKRRVIDFFLENTAAHYEEHLPWMRELVKR
jgi:hypothetical protein